MPIRHDISLWRGNSAPALLWTLPEDSPDGADYFLTVEAGGRLVLCADTPAGSLIRDAEAGTLSWIPNPAQSRLVPEGRVARYEIEQRRLGAETTIFFGTLTGIGGANFDAAPLHPAALDASDPDNSSLLLSGWFA